VVLGEPQPAADASLLAAQACLASVSLRRDSETGDSETGDSETGGSFHCDSDCASRRDLDCVLGCPAVAPPMLWTRVAAQCSLYL
jgi:hypothetical protein